MKRSIALIFTFVLAACDAASGGAAGSDTKTEDGFTQVPNIDGMQAKMPANAKPNAIGGGAGFHSEDKTVSIIIMKVADAEAGKTFEDAKKSAEELFFKKWIKSDKTEDGWVLQYESPKLDAEANEVGTQMSYRVRKKVGEQLIDCYGSTENKEAFDASIETCKSLKAI